ncbi:MAG TPA: hypothetical protein VF746_03645 [Longimicrobium sp.]|jgi:hypothetical protein
MSLKSYLSHRANPIRAWLAAPAARRQEAVETHLMFIREALGRIEARQTAERAGQSLWENEFKVYSQWGEDGIIQFLVRTVPVANRVFVEFGVENYTEANTRFLLVSDGWSGLVMDGDADQIGEVKRSREYWMYNLKAVHAFVTRDNINSLLAENGLSGEIGLLSIDIDGNDYWIWEAIRVVEPTIVVVEYNYRFGPEAAVTIPYADDFNRFSAHPSRIYYGASLRALCLLAERKGYDFVGCGRNGVNAFFVRKDRRPSSLPALSAAEGYVPGTFAEPQERDGEKVRLRFEEEIELLRSLDLPLVNVERMDGGREG